MGIESQLGVARFAGGEAQAITTGCSRVSSNVSGRQKRPRNRDPFRDQVVSMEAGADQGA